MRINKLEKLSGKLALIGTVGIFVSLFFSFVLFPFLNSNGDEYKENETLNESRITINQEYNDFQNRYILNEENSRTPMTQGELK